MGRTFSEGHNLLNLLMSLKKDGTKSAFLHHSMPIKMRKLHYSRMGVYFWYQPNRLAPGQLRNNGTVFSVLSTKCLNLALISTYPYGTGTVPVLYLYCTGTVPVLYRYCTKYYRYLPTFAALGDWKSASLNVLPELRIHFPVWISRY